MAKTISANKMENKELETWLSETKAKNLSLHQLAKYISMTDLTSNDIYCQLEGEKSQDKAQILFNQWQKEKEQLTYSEAARKDERITTAELIKSMRKEKEFSPKRGDRVLVLVDDNKYEERIFLQKLEGANCQFLVVAVYNEKEYLENKPFDHYAYSNMKPLPTEQPKETDFKSQVIELIESEIKKCQEREDENSKNKNYYYALMNINDKITYKDLLEKIKKLC